ncbi:glycosyl hydrolase family 95 catalytic domain-containing protein [Cellulomonas biazotea]|uniref:Uncharacterized protein n=1 Tax=Cellulomonas biazotea TaxID=1709 RepID=A0A402DT43_9CELL|nr:glycoside hydrolase N-terminal domain-containing protein [Cellulomonas biazotea]GCE77278.1 hypothetical protein CBZ_23340 [Cellulomonas biazotea]
MTASPRPDVGATRRTVLSSAGPARRWVEAFPVGNGRLGAMLHGGADRARVQVNDATAWSGRPDGPARALAGVRAGGAGPERLAQVRQALADGRHDDAADLLAVFQGGWTQAFQPFVDVHVTLVPDTDASAPGVRSGAATAAGDAPGARADGVRRLDLRDGVVTEHLPGSGGAAVEVEWFASAVDGALHGRWSSASPFGLRLELSTEHDVRADHRSAGGRVLVLALPDDVAPGHEPDATPVTRSDAGESLTGVAALLACSDGEVAAADDALSVAGATWVEVVVATGTTSPWPDDGPLRPRDEVVADVLVCARQALPSDRAAGDGVRARHVADHRRLADATRLALVPGDLDVRLPDALTSAPHATLAQAVFDHGRYLLVASSRPGSPPANLQGVWNPHLQPPWSSNYTLNINAEMAYWGAEAVGLGECHEPLLAHVGLVARHGRAVARELYGCDGWVAHHNSDVWGWALPVGAGHGDPSWAHWWMGGVWLCRHLWDHADYSGDLVFLREQAWPVLRGAAAFCLDWLVEAPDGSLTTSPSTSPENQFVLPSGAPGSLTTGATMDLALVRDLFERCLDTVALLGLDDAIVRRLRAALARLARPEVGPDGTVREWPHDLPAVDPHHRHLSHLVGLYPLHQVDVTTTPDLAAAAARSLDARGPGSTGWSLAWKTALRARLGDGIAVGDLLAEAMRPGESDAAAPWQGGLLPNLFSTHPPFQVDGNLGLVAAVAEALVQSTPGRLRVLPALPPQWPDGAVRGVRARGGLTVDVTWAGGVLREVVLRASRGGTLDVVHAGRSRTVTTTAGSVVRLDGHLAEVPG